MVGIDGDLAIVGPTLLEGDRERRLGSLAICLMGGGRTAGEICLGGNLGFFCSVVMDAFLDGIEEGLSSVGLGLFDCAAALALAIAATAAAPGGSSGVPGGSSGGAFFAGSGGATCESLSAGGCPPL